MVEFGKPTLDNVLRQVAAAYAAKPAIIFEEQRVTYGELYSRAACLSRSFRRIGIRKNDKVAIILPNCLEYMYVYFALFIVGAWAVPLSTRYERDELRSVLKDSDAKCVVYGDRIGAMEYHGILRSLTPDLPLISRFVCMGDDCPRDAIPLSDLLAEQPGDAGENGTGNETVEPEDVALLAYTSGTTGSPKGVMIPHKNLVLTSSHTANLWNAGDEVAFSVAPLYAAQGFLAVLIDLVAGITMKWISNYNPNDILTHLAREGVTAFHTQPTMWSILVSLPAFAYVDLKRLKKVVVSGSLCSHSLARRIQDSVGGILLNAYGLIEATGVVTITRPEDPEEVRLKTVGSPIPGVEIKIVDEERRELKKGEVGELAVRGYLMKGYYKKREQTEAVIDRDGWLYTGDLASFCEDGVNVTIVGRCKDMVIRGGFNVYPLDIEECLLGLGKIEDVAVVGRRDEILGESLVAFVIPKPEAEITEAEVKGYCRGRIANYKIPDEVFFVSQFPVLLSGKVRKNVLAEWAEKGIPEENRIFFNGVSAATGA
jgi:fatty-acyl-CoA synthase